MHIRLWGTRGSIPTPGQETFKYGGNTSCVEVRLDDGTLLIFDCGTGARKLGISLAASGPTRAHMVLGHTHADHIQGLPFFVPAFLPGSHLTIYGPRGLDRSLPAAIGGQLDYAYFPVPLQDLPSDIEFEELEEGELTLGSCRIRTQYLNHTSPCLAYRLEVGGQVLVYATDHEPHARDLWRGDRPAGVFAPQLMVHPLDSRHAEFLWDADLVIHDAQYTDEEYPTKVGWGHSTVEYVVDLAMAARVKRLFLFHHDPLRDDASLDALVERCQARVREAGMPLHVEAAVEGAGIQLSEQAPTSPVETVAAPLPSLPPVMRVLVAEDDDMVAKVIELGLRRDHYEVVHAKTGLEAVRLACEQHFDLVLLDVQMPVMDGLEACRALRGYERFKDMPIVMLTARTDQQDIEAGFSQGVTDYMTKPFAVSQLRARVRSWITRTAAERMPAETLR